MASRRSPIQTSPSPGTGLREGRAGGGQGRRADRPGGEAGADADEAAGGPGPAAGDGQRPQPRLPAWPARPDGGLPRRSGQLLDLAGGDVSAGGGEGTGRGLLPVPPNPWGEAGGGG